MEYLWISLKILAFISGIFLIYLGAFLYEDEEKKINNKLEDIWLSLDDTSKGLSSKLRAFVKKVGNIIYSGLRALFGEKLLSLKTFLTSLLLSISSINFSFGFIGLLASPFNPDDLYFNLTNLIGFIGMIFVSILSLIGALHINYFKNERLKRFLLVFALAAALTELFIFFDFIRTTEEVLWTVFLAAMIGLIATLMDFFFILITIKILKFSSKTNHLGASILLIFSNAIMIVLFTIVPLISGLYFILNNALFIPEDSQTFFGTLNSYLGFALLISPFSSIPAILISLLFFILSIFLILHKLFWPLILRPIYALQRNGVLKYKKGLIALGIFLIGVLFPAATEQLKNIIDKL